MLLPRHREDLGFGDIEFLSMLPAVHFHSSLLSTHDVINVTPFTITFTTAALDRSSLWRFEASPLQGDSEGPTFISRTA